jgi:hypothetical protein
MILEDDPLGLGFCFLRASSGAKANGEIGSGSGSTGRFAGVAVGALPY